MKNRVNEKLESTGGRKIGVELFNEAMKRTDTLDHNQWLEALTTLRDGLTGAIAEIKRELKKR